ncbi:Geranylgeranyl transferase type-2 subunit beta [Trichinella spiralis]|uniref:Geranylgeranyl transferase type-2 subunit beta n=1 Tax=Trichinella spiralis TaxID=6334 RepID=A0ABR3KA15_TRISP
MDYVKTIEDVKFVLMAPMLTTLNANHRIKTQSAMDTIRTVDRPPGNDQFVQLISFISGCYVSDTLFGSPSSQCSFTDYELVGILPLSQLELASLRYHIRDRMICCECVPRVV